MINEEAIEIIKIAIAEVKWNYPMDYAIAFENAISALEKQIPKKSYEDYNGEIHKDKCPTCHRTLFPNEHHCKCGQALDWSDVK